jgi:penicillin V acylase-like amidase (Ntn superfamily)
VKKYVALVLIFGIVSMCEFGFAEADINRCSSFMLKKEPVLLFGHNLDNDTPVPGLVYINKRGILKKGCTFKELTTPEQQDPSSLVWISQFGSVTFGQLGANFPDGGMNEVGLFVWEMSLMNTTFIQDKTLPKLFMMQWMQYVLDNCSTVDEAIKCACSIAMDGWNWQFFVADRHGNCASIAFILGKPVIYTGDTMPVPMLGNAPYADEIERLKYFKGFGGGYSASLEDMAVPRFVHAARLLRDYQTNQPAVDYAFRVLKQLWRSVPSNWSVVCDPVGRKVYFRTDQSKEMKHFALDELDLSNRAPVQILDIDFEKAGDVAQYFTDHTSEENRRQIKRLLTSWWDPNDMPKGWTDMNTLIDRFASYYGSPVIQDTWDFAGTWKGKAVIANGEPFPDENEWEVTIRCENGGVFGEITDSKGKLQKEPLDNFVLNGRRLFFTFRLPYSSYYFTCKVDSYLENGKMLGSFYLYRQRYGEPGRISLEKQHLIKTKKKIKKQ